MKKVFLFLAALLTATVMNLHAVDITSWTIVGDQAMMGSHWEPTDTKNDMRVVEGSYQLKKFAYLTEGGFDYKATANHQWTIKEIPASVNQTLEITADGDYLVTFTLDAAGTTLTAYAELWTSDQAEVDTYVNDKSMGSVTGAGEYELGEQVTLTATPNAGYKFVNWSGDQTGTENPLSITVTKLYTAVQANFESETPAPVPYVKADGTVDTCKTYTVVEDASSAVTWNAGWYVVQGTDVKLTAGAQCSGEVHLILADGAKLTASGGEEQAGIEVTGGSNSLTIYGQAGQMGQLIATGGTEGCAGIGGNAGVPGSDITINGGKVTATGGNQGAGIGGGDEAFGTNITINGGTVTATGGMMAAGIGGGSQGSGSNITINGGKVNATCDDLAAGIGGGSGGSGSNITINGGEVTANGADSGAGIGGGENGSGSNITISGGTVKATGGSNGAGIGGGLGADGLSITINGGTVTAIGGNGAAGIGGGQQAFGLGIKISGGIVAATGGSNGAGIGGGQGADGLGITIDDGTVTATGGDNAAGIGGGEGEFGMNITIRGGSVTATGGDNAAGIGSGSNGDASINIYVNPLSILKADNNNPPTTEIAHASITTDVASELAGKRYAMVISPDMHDFLYFVGLNGEDTIRLNKWSYFGATSLAKLTATFEYSKDRINWTAYDTWGEATSVEASEGYFAFGNSIALNQGDTVFFRAKGTNGKNATMSSTELTYFYFAFGVDDSIAAGGNTMSLYDATCEQDTMTRVGFCGLFKDAKQLISAPELPATKLEYGCYNEMFFGCTSLTTAPALPVTTLAVNCYSYMFQDCSSLTQAPELKATTMAFMCYGGMFSGCTSLTTAPALPATKLDGSCYNGMFSGCTALTQAPELKATTLDIHCYYEMFKGCTSLQVDTLSGDCNGAELEVPSPASEPGWWNENMFAGCHGDAKYTTKYGIQLGGHYCIKEFIPDTIKGIELIAVDTIYDGQNHYIQVNGTIEGDAVTYSTDSATWKQDTIQLKNAAEQTVYVRIQRTDHIDWYGKSSIKIAKKELTVDSVIIAEKVYDGTFTATVKSSKLVGVVKGESVGLDVRGEFNDKNTGKDKDVTVEYRLEGSEVISNYTLQTTSETVKGTITPKTLTVTGTTASEKEYDGNTTASVTAGTLSGVVESDDVQIDTSTGAFEDKNAGENKNVITTYTLSGADSQNYTTNTDTIQANITPKQLTISGTTVADKTYDGMFDAVVDTLGTVEGIVAGDPVKVTATAYFNDRNAGEGKDVTVEYSVEGEGYTNYQAPDAYNTAANINKRPITITSGSAMKVFDNMPLTNSKVEVTEGSWADDEGAELNATGSQTQVGSSPNYFDIIYNANTTGANYDITIVEGTLTVKDYGTCAEANATPVDEVLGLKPVVVTYVNGAYTYVKDATGASLIYADYYGLNAGDQVTGFTGESAPDKYGLPRVFPSKKSSELTIVAGAAPEPELRTATPTMNEIHQYVRYENVKIGSALLTPATPVEATLNNGDQIVLNSKFGSSYIIEGGEDITYDIVAIVGVRDEVMELYPTVIAIHTSVNLNDVNADNRVVEKYVKDGQLYIRVNGVLYNASGIRVQ